MSFMVLKIAPSLKQPMQMLRTRAFHADVIGDAQIDHCNGSGIPNHKQPQLPISRERGASKFCGALLASYFFLYADVRSRQNSIYKLR